VRSPAFSNENVRFRSRHDRDSSAAKTQCGPVPP
jgi:hypothetical protein